MTNTEIIQAIKAEIERRKGQLIRGACAAQIEMETNCKEEAYDEVLSFLDTLESEKPINQDELEKEISRTYHDGSVTDTSDLDHNSYENIARHFAKWGAEQQKDKDTRDMYMSDNRHFQKVYELGRKDEREQMMKEAVEGTIVDAGFDDHTALVSIPDKRYDEGDKVRIIIVKEDEK